MLVFIIEQVLYVKFKINFLYINYILLKEKSLNLLL